MNLDGLRQHATRLFSDTRSSLVNETRGIVSYFVGDAAKFSTALLGTLTILSVNIFSFVSWMPSSLYLFVDSTFVFNHVSLIVLVYAISRFFGVTGGGIIGGILSMLSATLRWTDVSERRALPLADRKDFRANGLRVALLLIAGRRVRKFFVPVAQWVVTYLTFCYFYLDLSESAFFTFAFVFTLMPGALIVVLFSVATTKKLRPAALIRRYGEVGAKRLFLMDLREVSKTLSGELQDSVVFGKILSFASRVAVVCLLLLSNALGDARAQTLLGTTGGQLRWSDSAGDKAPFAVTSSGVIFVSEVFRGGSEGAQAAQDVTGAAFTYVSFDQIDSFDASIRYKLR